MKTKLLMLIAASLLAASPVTLAGTITYTIAGKFSGSGTGDPILLASATPVLINKNVVLTFAIDDSVGGVPGGPIGAIADSTVYDAITSSAATFAGFTTSPDTCPSSSSTFICTVHARDGTGFGLGGTGADTLIILPAISSSSDFQTAIGESRSLSLQFITSLIDFSGAFLDDDALDFNLTLADLSLFSGKLSIFARESSGLFNRADLEFTVESVNLGEPSSSVPEPTSLSLVTLGLLALGLRTGTQKR